MHSSAAGATAPARAPGPESSRVRQLGASEPSPTAHAQSQNAFDYEHQADADQAYLDETRRAIELYQAFIERAGDDPEYRAAVKRSREQIEDLTSARIFVEEGRRSRAKAAQ